MERCRFFMDEEAAMLTTHGCLRACSAVIRAPGSTVSRRSMKSLARLDTLGQGYRAKTSIRARALHTAFPIPTMPPPQHSDLSVYALSPHCLLPPT